MKRQKGNLAERFKAVDLSYQAFREQKILCAYIFHLYSRERRGFEPHSCHQFLFFVFEVRYFYYYVCK